jgi:hypothetical protein
MHHDQNFKNLILDYPLQALRFFAPDAAAHLPDTVQITPIRQEQLQSRLGDRFRELDCPLRVDWPDGQCAALLFALEEETEPRHFSIHRLIHYCVDLAELCETDRIVPVVIFLRPGECPAQFRLGTVQEDYLTFRYVACHLPGLSYDDYRSSDNIVARLNLFNMAPSKVSRLQRYDQSVRGLFELEENPGKRQKYIEFIDVYANLSEAERAEYTQYYLNEESAMTTFAGWFREQGMQQGVKQGRQQGMQQGMQQGFATVLLTLLSQKFSQEMDDAMRRRIQQADTDTLRHWSERVLTAKQLQDIFA